MASAAFFGLNYGHAHLHTVHIDFDFISLFSPSFIFFELYVHLLLSDRRRDFTYVEVELCCMLMFQFESVVCSSVVFQFESESVCMCIRLTHFLVLNSHYCITVSSSKGKRTGLNLIHFVLCAQFA